MSVKGRKRAASGEKAERRARDFYPTPTWCVRRLLDAIGDQLPHVGSRWFEPAVGNGAIANAVSEWYEDRFGTHSVAGFRSTWITSDIKKPNFPIGWFYQGDYLTWDLRGPMRGQFGIDFAGFELAITNPPFEVYDPNDGRMHDGGVRFYLKMRRDARIVIMLHRLDWLASAKRNDTIRADMPDVYVLPDRTSFTGDGKADAQTYAWFVWGLSNGGRTEVLATTPIEERREAKKMAPKTSTKSSAPTKAAKKASKKRSTFDADAFDDELDAKVGGGKSKSARVTTDALERARAEAHEDLAAERESKAKASSKKAVTDAPAKKVVGPVPAKSKEGMRCSKPDPKDRLDYRLVESFPKLVKVELSADEAKKELDRHANLEAEIAGLQEKKKRDEKFIDTQLAGGDAVTKRAKAEEITVRKKIAGATIGKLKALATQALNAAANRFKWVEIECERRADDYGKTMHTFRLDTNAQMSVMKMSEPERKDSDTRRQVEMNFTGK